MVDPIPDAPSQGQTNYRVVSDYFLVSHAFAAQGRGTLPPDTLIGRAPENSCTIWIPTLAVKTEGVVAVAERLAFFPAHIFVDNSGSASRSTN